MNNDKTVSSVMQRKVIALHQDSPVREAAHAMCENAVGCVVVVDRAQGVVGILTDRDLACGNLGTAESGNLPVSELMTPNPLLAEGSASVDSALRTMEENGIRRLPVVASLSHPRANCIGILTLDDLIVTRCVDAERLARIVEAQIKRGSIQGLRAERAWRAQESSEARREQTLKRFYSTISEAMETTDPDRVMQFTRIILASLTRRLHFRGAAHFIAQLPDRLQEELLDLPAGPDRSITMASIFLAIQSRLGFSEDSTRTALTRFLAALSHLIEPHEFDHVRAQLPEEMQAYFPRFQEKKSA